ncbi:MMPL family transporter, partial [Amycolatopsis solani]
AAAALLLLAAPAADLRTFTPDVRILPPSSSVRAGYDAVDEEFGRGTASPIVVVVRGEEPLPGSAGGDEARRLHDRLAGLDHVRRVDPPSDLLEPALRPAAGHYLSADRRSIVLEVVPDDHASAESTRALLTAVRAATAELPGGLTAITGGETAEGVDANAAIEDRLPLVLLVLAVVTYLLLMLVFRAVFLPLKAIAMNLLSLAATYGVLVAVFQWNLAGFGYVQNFVPVLLLAILFSLSTDYEVFLLDRVREEHLAGASDVDSVAAGLTRTAPLISGAAVLMVAVFGAFMLAGILPIRQLGFGLAIGIALDATLIRLVVAPAAMRLMGRWNWWPSSRRRTPAAPSPTLTGVTR